MQAEALQRFLSASPAVHLLRSPNAAWILAFLHQRFKQDATITRGHSELVAELRDYLEAQTAEPSELGTATERAEAYLATWCSATTGWLRRVFDDSHDEPIYELTQETEMVLAFVSKAIQEHPLVSTQSRLRSIVHLLEEVSSRGSPDPKRRVEQLLRQRAEIDRELQGLQEEPTRFHVDASAIREQFTLAVQQLEQLKSEFRAVENRFKSITREVQDKILSSDETRGGILEFALDSEELLKKSDQGRSFFEFLKTVHAPQSQQRIMELVRQLHDLEALSGHHQELESIRSMVPTLLAEAEKVLRTTQHLSTVLRRLLDTRSTRHHRQLANLLRDIRGLAVNLNQRRPNEIGMELEVDLEIQSPMDRGFWSQTEPFAEVELHPAVAGAEEQALAIERLASLERIDWQAMRRNVTMATQRRGRTTLDELLHDYPIQSGVVELLGYLQIAHDDGHWIQREQIVEIQSVWDGSRARALRLPRITFLPVDERRRARQKQSASLEMIP